MTLSSCFTCGARARSTYAGSANDYSVELCHNDEPTGIYAGKNSPEATTLTWFLNHSPERLLEIAHIESTKEACQALFGMPRIPFEKE